MRYIMALFTSKDKTSTRRSKLPLTQLTHANPTWALPGAPYRLQINDSASKIMQISSHFFSKESIKATQETKHNHCKILMQYAYVQH